MSWAKTRVLVRQTSPPSRSEFRMYYPISKNYSETEETVKSLIPEEMLLFS